MNKKGSTLVMAIVLVALMSVLALGLFTIIVSDKKQVVQQDDYMQCYYIARAGTDAVAEHIINNPLEIESFSAKSDDGNLDGDGDFDNDDKIDVSSLVHLGNGNFETYVIQKDWNDDGTISEVEIVSTGYVGNRSKTVSLNLKQPEFNSAIFSDESFSLDLTDIIHGHVGSNGAIHGNAKERLDDDENYEYMEVDIKSWAIPSVDSVSAPIDVGTDFVFDSLLVNPPNDLIWDTDLNDSNKSIEALLDDIEGLPYYDVDDVYPLEYDSIEINNPSTSGITTFNTLPSDYVEDPDDPIVPVGSIGTGHHMVVVVRNGEIDPLKPDAYFKSHVQVLGNYSVFICVDEGAFLKIQTPNELGPIYNPDQLVIILGKGATLELQTPAILNARIIGPEAEVQLKSGTVNGSIIAGEFVGGSNCNVIYVETDFDYLAVGFSRVEWK